MIPDYHHFNKDVERNGAGE